MRLCLRLLIPILSLQRYFIKIRVGMLLSFFIFRLGLLGNFLVSLFGHDFSLFIFYLGFLCLFVIFLTHLASDSFTLLNQASQCLSEPTKLFLALFDHLMINNTFKHLGNVLLLPRCRQNTLHFVDFLGQLEFIYVA